MTDPILTPEPTPEHGERFWNELDERLRTDATRVMPVVGDAAASTDPPAPAPGSNEGGRRADGSVADLDEARARRSRRLWPLVAAAVALAAVGIGALVFRPVSPGDTTDVVAAGDDTTTALGEPPVGDGDAVDDAPVATPVASAEPAPTAEPTPGTADPTPAADGDATPAPAQTPVPQVMVRALGNDDTEVWLPNDAFPEDTRFLGTWEEQDVSWYALITPGTDCTADRHVELARVNSSGIPLPIADPQPGFNGNVSHFTLSGDQRRVAFVAECDGQLEFYVAALSPEVGRLDDLRLAWAGRGSDTAALVQWDGSTVSLNSIDDNGQPFYVDVDPVTGTVDGSALPEDGPQGRDPWLVGATTDATYTWWNADAPAGAATCNGDAPYLRSPDRSWQLALIDGGEIGAIGSFTIERSSSQVAFTDACSGINVARVFIGTLRADGLISSLRTIDMSTYGTGEVDLVQWIDPNTLRIHLDSSNTGGGILQFEWIFDEGRQAGFLQQVG